LHIITNSGQAGLGLDSLVSNTFLTDQTWNLKLIFDCLSIVNLQIWLLTCWLDNFWHEHEPFLAYTDKSMANWRHLFRHDDGRNIDEQFDTTFMTRSGVQPVPFFILLLFTIFFNSFKFLTKKLCKICGRLQPPLLNYLCVGFL
jgi:hypothetical protein